MRRSRMLRGKVTRRKVLRLQGRMSGEGTVTIAGKKTEKSKSQLFVVSRAYAKEKGLA
jgi:hypothetical protein